MGVSTSNKPRFYLCMLHMDQLTKTDQPNLPNLHPMNIPTLFLFAGSLGLQIENSHARFIKTSRFLIPRYGIVERHAFFAHTGTRSRFWVPASFPVAADPREYSVKEEVSLTRGWVTVKHSRPPQRLRPRSSLPGKSYHWQME